MLIYYSDIGKRELQPMVESHSRESPTVAGKASAIRTLRLLGAYLLAAATVAACGPGCDRTSQTPRGALPPPGSRIVIIGPPGGNPAWPAIRGGAKRCGEQTPNLAVVTAIPEDATAAGYKRLIQQILSEPAVAVCLYVPPWAAGNGDVVAAARSADGDAESADVQRNSGTSQPAAADPFNALARDIQNRGALLITIGRELPPGAAFGHVGVDWPRGAELLGRRLKAIAPDKSSYVLLHERGRSQSGSECYDSFNLSATRELMTRLTDRVAARDGEHQLEQIREMLVEFPAAGLVVTLTPEPWLVSPAQRLPPENAIATLSAVPPLWPRLASGEAAALVGPLDGQIGFMAVELAWQGLTGAEPAGRRRLVPCELVTPQTRADFERRYAEAAGVSTRELGGGG